MIDGNIYDEVDKLLGQGFGFNLLPRNTGVVFSDAIRNEVESAFAPVEIETAWFGEFPIELVPLPEWLISRGEGKPVGGRLLRKKRLKKKRAKRENWAWFIQAEVMDECRKLAFSRLEREIFGVPLNTDNYETKVKL